MNFQSAKKKTKKRSLQKSIITALLLIICVLAWIGISNLQAAEDESGDTSTGNFQNAAQAQHANNVATGAALQDPDVAAAISKAEETGAKEDIAKADALLAETIGVLTQDISNMRGSGMGWGEIAQHFGLHPSVLGLGHSKSTKLHGAQISKQIHERSEFEAATARNFKGGKDKGHSAGTISGSKGLGLAHAKGHSNHPGKGLALGHNKGKGGGRSEGQGLGHAAGHSNGHGGGHAGGHGGGHGGGQGGGHGGGQGGGHGGGQGGGHK